MNFMSINFVIRNLKTINDRNIRAELDKTVIYMTRLKVNVKRKINMIQCNELGLREVIIGSARNINASNLRRKTN